ncbi:MAG: hypothetical protein VX876_01715 [Planctomycetota bacterium]|nr:hypothetical protein [Planctomycetota bacterium]
MAGRLVTALVSFMVVSIMTEQAKAQVLVLPSGQIASVGTTVNVPDGGFVLLGSVCYGAEGMVQQRLSGLPYLWCVGGMPVWNHRAYGAYNSQPQIYLGARIHNFEMLDRNILHQGRQILATERAARLLPPKEKPLPTRIPSALKRSFSSER